MAEEGRQIIFNMVKVGKTLPSGKKILNDIYLGFYYGAKIGILGLNGSGKSTLMRIIAGKEKSFEGDVMLSPGYTIGHLEQEPELDETKTVIEIVREGVQPVMDLLKEYEDVNNKFADEEILNDPDKMDKLIARQAVLQDKIEATGAWEIDQKLDIAMDALRCPDPDQKINVLSGGERRRVALCRLLLQAPDILLLDEPTNHLDAESVAWLEHHLADYKGTVIAITHDRYFLDNVAGWILELDRGEGIPYKGNYTNWLEQKTARLAQEEKTESKRARVLKQELEWVRSNAKARRTKSKARLQNYEKMQGESVKEKEAKLEIYIPNGQRLGDKVIEFKGVSKAFGDRVLFENVSFSLPPAGIIGIIGPNGAGKTTMFRMIMGDEKPDTGTVTLGDTVQLAYVDQSHKDLLPDRTVWEVLSNAQEQMLIGGTLVNSRAYLARFNFTGPDQNKKVGVLSGGERNRLHLAMTLKNGSNVLLLDEPTNDLDVNTLRALEEGIEDYSGCAVIISHDRWFMDRVCTHILAFEGDSQVYWFEGGFSEYEENHKKRVGDIIPHRLKYKKLVRG
ncbi:MAG: energy-dependent translational throttle protein EttA [Flavobacteriales bacterium]|nr:energy-dependent translational throttle protein EttA [Flavobacteriales bacterium]MBP6390893.1 energy-dependent translational throttle protein EttA [Flavobacteriales bacterium]